MFCNYIILFFHGVVGFYITLLRIRHVNLMSALEELKLQLMELSKRRSPQSPVISKMQFCRGLIIIIYYEIVNLSCTFEGKRDLFP